MRQELKTKLLNEIDEAIESLDKLHNQIEEGELDPKQIDRVARDISLMASAMKDCAYKMGEEVKR